jgi:hypothetical protein
LLLRALSFIKANFHFAVLFSQSPQHFFAFCSQWIVFYCLNQQLT